MTTLTPITELRRMPLPELRRELRTKRAECAKVRMAVEMQSEKKHAQLPGMRKEIARMEMVARELEKSTPTTKAANIEKKVASAESPRKPSQKTPKSVKSPGTKSKKS